jgi:hypothetical protein
MSECMYCQFVCCICEQIGFIRPGPAWCSRSIQCATVHDNIQQIGRVPRDLIPWLGYSMSRIAQEWYKTLSFSFISSGKERHLHPVSRFESHSGHGCVRVCVSCVGRYSVEGFYWMSTNDSEFQVLIQNRNKPKSQFSVKIESKNIRRKEHIQTNKLRGLNPRANYTDRATAVCRRNDCQLLRIEGTTWSAWRTPTAVFLVF